jgi:hypothetical protein
LIWIGSEEEISLAKKLFWSAVREIVNDYELSEVQAVDKLHNFYLRSANFPKMKKVFDVGDNKIWRINLDKLPHEIDKFRCSSGFFYEFNASSLSILEKIVTPRFQTLSYFGFEKEYLEKIVTEYRLRGIDRFVPIGHSTDFSLVWDGYDLPLVYTREVTII